MDFELNSEVFKVIGVILLVIFVVAWLFNQPQLVALTLLGTLVLLVIIADVYLKHRKEGF